MVLIFLFCLLTTFICMSFGHMVMSFVNKMVLAQEDEHLENNFFFQFLLGISAISFIGTLANNWMGMNGYFLTGIFLVSATYVIINKSKLVASYQKLNILIKPFDFVFFAFVIFIIAIALSKAAMGTSIYDEMGYYLSTVKWIENGATIPGTALLNGRIAINSAWHMCSAIFGYNFLYDGGTYDLNALIFCFIYALGIKSGRRLIRFESRYFSSDLMLVAALIFPFYSLIDSMDADFPSIFIGIFLISEMLRKLTNNTMLIMDRTYYYYLIISLFLFTIRPFSGLFLLYPIAVALHYFLKNRYAPLIFFSVLSIIYVTPWLYKNYLLSGYLIYPLNSIDFFDPLWKLPYDYVRNTRLVIEEFSKLELLRSDYLYSGVQSHDVRYWLPIWFDNNWKLIIGKFVIIILPFCSLILICQAIFLKNKTYRWYFKFTLFVICLLWFFKYPSIRFGWAFILGFVLMTFVDFQKIYRKANRYLSYIILLLAFLSFLRTGLKAINAMVTTPSLIYPAKTPKLIDYTIIETNFTYYLSKSEYCNDKIPCAPAHIPWKVYQRTLRLSDGFVLKPDINQ